MNSLQINLTNRVVVVRQGAQPSPVEDRKFLCQAGFGCLPFTNGRNISGYYLKSNAPDTIDAMEDIESIWVDPNGSTEPVVPTEPVDKAVAAVQEAAVAGQPINLDAIAAELGLKLECEGVGVVENPPAPSEASPDTSSSGTMDPPASQPSGCDSDVSGE